MANEFVIRISADDKATATVKKIQSALGKITDPIDKVQKKTRSLGEVGQAGLERLHKGLNKVGQAARDVADRVVEIIPGLAALGGAATLAGISALAVKFGNFGFGLNKSSKLLDMNAQDLAAWHVAAKRAGVSAEEFDSSMSGSQMAIRETAMGANPTAMAMLIKMGLQIARNKDGTIDYYETQMRLMKAIPKLKTVEAQRDVAGAFSMGSLLPMLQQGTYAADKARAMRKGLIPTDAEIARAVAFHQNINDLEDSVTGLGNSIGSSLTPVLEPLIIKFSAWLDAHRVEIANKLAEAVQKFSAWIQSIDWDSVSAKAKAFWDAIGGIKGVLIAIAAITFAGPIAGVVGLIGKLTALTTTVIPAGIGAFAALGLAATAAAAAYTIEKIKDSTEPGHFVGRNAGAPMPTTLRASDTNAALAAGVSQGMHDFFSTQTGHFVSRADSNAHGGTGGMEPLGIRNNNPLNMLDHGNEITYATPEEGIAKAAENLRRGYRGLTLAGIADKWTGGARTGNSPEQMANYVGLMSRGTGLGANDIPDLDDNSTVAALIKSQIRAENGKQPYSDEQVDAGVRQSSAGASESPAATSASDDAAHAAQIAALQQHTVTFDFKNVPSGARVDAKSSDGSYLPTKVNYAMGGQNFGAMP